jgi:hypothetical protein
MSWEMFRVVNGGTEVPIAADGTFVAHHVPPGTYVLTVNTSTAMDSGAMPYYLATRTITVGGKNAGGLVLNVARTQTRDLSGTVVFEGGLREHTTIAVGRLLARFSAKAEVAMDGSFVIRGMWPGRYSLNASAIGGEVTSVRLGPDEILNRALCGGLRRCGEFDFDDDSARLRVTVAKTGRVSGTVTQGGSPVFGAGVILVRVGEEYEPAPENAVQGQTDETGGFTVAQVLPGSYRVYVVDNSKDAEQMMADAAFRRISDRAPAVQVVAGDNEALQLVLPRM